LRGRLRVFQERRPLGEQLIAHVEDDLLRIERLSCGERRAVIRAATTLGAGVTIEKLLPAEVADRGRAEGLLDLDVLDEPERAAGRLLPEEHVRKRRDDVQG